MKNKYYFTKYLILVLPLLFINLNAQDQVDPLEAARLAKSAAEKAQAEADAATEAAIQSAATKAATQALHLLQLGRQLFSLLLHLFWPALHFHELE